MTNQVIILPSEEQIKKLEDDPERFKHMLSLFQNWLRYQTHLPQNFNKTILAHFLRSCKMDLEKTKKKFEVFCYLPLTYEKLYANRAVTLERDLEVLDWVYACVLPEITAEGYRISVVKPINIEKCDILSLFRISAMIADFRLHHETFITGEIMICDLEHAGPQFYGKIFTPLLLHLIKIGTEAYPTRTKKIFIVSCHPLLEKGINMCKSILPDKIKHRFYFLNNAKDLCKYIPEKFLPSDYNGTQTPLAYLNKGWKNLLMENLDFFKVTDQMKPIGPIPKHISVDNENLGMDGSFRKLNID